MLGGGESLILSALRSGLPAITRARPRETPTGDSGRTRVTRRHIQVALGVLWLLDGMLQLQPFMFSREFAAKVIAPSAAGQPAWVAWPVHQAASMIGAHPVALDVVIALIQLALGIGFLWPRTARTAVVLSVPWAVGIWLMGEGLGGLAGGSSSMLVGAPGAVSLYALLAMAAWPGPPFGTGSADRSSNGGVAEWYPLAWAAMWFDLALLALLPANRSASAVSGQISGAVGRVPGWLGHIDHLAANGVHAIGGLTVVLLAVVPTAIALLALGTVRQRSLAAWCGIALALISWMVGQNFGLLASGTATDPNTGPLLALSGVALLGTQTSRRWASHIGGRASDPNATRHSAADSLRTVPGAT